MNAKYRHVVWAAVLAAPLAGVLSAQEPAPPPFAGRVLILDNERALEGVVSRQGDSYLIRRAVGEVAVPAAQVVVVCGTLEEAYQFLSHRANLRDADERLRLARWCQGCGLRDQAIAEVQAALQLRPGHQESKQLLAVLRRPQAPTAVEQPASESSEPPTAAPPPLLEVSGDCLALFSTKVQPILMNTCASCHASGRGGNFVLLRSNDSTGRRSTQHNLSATLRQVCFDQPAASPLLFKACCAHGGAVQPPLATHQTTPIAILQGWVELVATRNAHLRPHGAPAVAAAQPKSPAPAAVVQVAFHTPATLAAQQSPMVQGPEARAVETYPAMVQTPGAPPPGAQSADPATPRPLPPLEAAPGQTGDDSAALAFNR